MERSQVYFREEQQFHRAWIWTGIGISLLVLLPMWYGVHHQLVEGVPLGDEPISDEALFLVTTLMTIFIVGVLYLFWNSRLIVSLDSEGIRYQFVPFHRRLHLIRWVEVERAFVRTYRPIIEYGGWGIRFGLKGKAYNVSGTDGLQLELKNGRKVLFGTLEPSRISLAMSQIPDASKLSRIDGGR